MSTKKITSASNGMEAAVYNQTGKETRSITLPELLFGGRWNGDLVHQVVTSLMANRRHNKAQTKDRQQVSGGGKKPWQQKGTGRSRHGSSRSPIWRGGGITHGPLVARNYAHKVTKQMKNKALLTILAKKWRDGEVLLVDDFAWSKPKTKEAATALEKLAKVKGFERLTYKKRGNRGLIALPVADVTTAKVFRNLPQVRVLTLNNVNPVDLLSYQYLVLANPEASFKVLADRAAKK
jgi:large subunit ribosomal protein L4